MAENKSLQGIFECINKSGLIVCEKRDQAPYVNKDGIQKQGGVTVVLQFNDHRGPQLEIYASRGTDAFNVADSLELYHIYNCAFRLNQFNSLEITDYIELK